MSASCGGDFDECDEGDGEAGEGTDDGGGGDDDEGAVLAGEDAGEFGFRIFGADDEIFEDIDGLFIGLIEIAEGLAEVRHDGGHFGFALMAGVDFLVNEVEGFGLAGGADAELFDGCLKLEIAMVLFVEMGFDGGG